MLPNQALQRKVLGEAVNKALLWLKVGYKKLRSGPKTASCEGRTHDLRISLLRLACARVGTDALANCAKGATYRCLTAQFCIIYYIIKIMFKMVKNDRNKLSLSAACLVYNAWSTTDAKHL